MNGSGNSVLGKLSWQVSSLVPLKKGDADVQLDRQRAFATVYNRARYQLSLNYAASLMPPLSEAEASWVSQLRS